MALDKILSFLLVLYLMLLCSTTTTTTAQTQRNISLGSSLAAQFNNDESWTSPSGEFAFGFHQIGQDGFLLAIWFNKISQKTIVWSANGNDLVQRGSTVELTRDGSLVLRDTTGRQAWTADVTGTGVAYAAMLDTGNFVLASQNFVNLWESFNKPTDTLLPTQTLVQSRKLVARFSEGNYSSGRFHLIVQTDGNLVLYTRRFPLEAPNYAYWESDTVGSGFQVRFNQSGYIYLQAQNGTILQILSSYANITKDFYQRAILEYDGVFRQYVYPKNDGPNSRGWRQEWSQSLNFIPPNICVSIRGDTGPGACGYNSYCGIGNDQRPNCYCPDGYSFIDPNDKMRGCKQNFEAQSCDDDSRDADHFDFISLESTNWPMADYEHFQGVTEDWCRKACLVDCLCSLVIYNNNAANCWKKRSPFSNGMIDSTSSAKALIKIRKDNSTSKFGGTDSKGKDRSTLIVIGSVLLSSSTFLNVLLLVASVILFRLRRKASVTRPNQIMPGMNLQIFSFAELEKATNGFKEQLGSGAFGAVFKGVLDFDNKSLAAVKKLDNMVKEGEQEFKAEVTAIGRTNHKNLVHLIGFCNEGQHRLLVYEFMSNGSLASFLFGPSKPNWHQRVQIAMGTARGLSYLHEECSTQIIHCDIKPQNILLDDSHAARISDFGLAKILKTDQTRTTTGIRGTKGYVAPEWFRSMPVTAKVDVYSYGILLLELICCRKNVELEAEDDAQMILADWAYDCYAGGRLELLVDNDDEAVEDMKRVERYVMVAIWCIQEDPSLRPTMKKVVQMLEGTVKVSIPPVPNSFISSL
ncbi:S-receptor-like serine/threonine-protein kinase [Trema orientale]|uniref:Receptor-like serine/threonine-protein kinase n=1 Tax=Trema orientale TaxID=63057 RepID=A0A2P5FU43_TREOI|nr:S-receptor-like serine/threonine-protein kinase [Trema orientale]